MASINANQNNKSTFDWNARLAPVVCIVERTPDVLRSLLGGLDASLTDANYGPNTWSSREIVGHLIFGEMTDWVPRARHVLEYGDTRPFTPIDMKGHEPLIKGRSMSDLLDEFERRRSESLTALAALKLTDADMDRPALHPMLGPVTLGNHLNSWATHDLNHIHQICKALAFQYLEGVGVWWQRLSILSPPNPRG